MSEIPVTNHSLRAKDEDILTKFAISAAGIGIWDLDPVKDSVILDERCRELFGMPPGAIVSYDAIQAHIHPADHQHVRNAIINTLVPRTDATFSVQFRTIQQRWLHVKGQAYFSTNGDAVRVAGIAQDITNEIAANEKAKEAEQLSALAMSSAGAGSFTMSFPDDTITYSPALSYMVTGESIGGSSHRDLFVQYLHPEDKHIRDRAHEIALETGMLDYETRFIWGDGSVHWVKIAGRYYYDRNGQPVTFSGMGIDTTTQREQEQRLLDAEQRFTLAFKNATIGMAYLDDQGIIKRTNKAFAALIGYPDPQVLTGREYHELVFEEHRPENTRLFNELTTHQRDVFNQVKRYHHTDGSLRWVQVNVARIASSTGKDDIVAIAFDISNEVAARKEQQQLLSLVENSSDLIVVATMEGHVTYMNDAGLALLGVGSKLNAVTKNIHDLFSKAQLMMVVETILPALRNTGKWIGNQLYRHLETKDEIPFYTNAFRLDSPMSGRPTAIAFVCRDLRAELDAQHALRQSEARFRALVEEAPVATALFLGPELLIEIANEAMMEMWNRGPEIIGQPLSFLLHRPSGQHFLSILHEIFRTGIAYHGKEEKVESTRGIRYYNFTYKPLLHADGKVYAIVSMAVDVTEQVLARNKILETQSQLESEVADRTDELAASNEELAAMNEELQSSNMSLLRSNQELEQYAYVASHDLQEPLRKIRIYADLLKSQKDLSDNNKRLVDKIDQSSERMSMLIKDLLEFSRLLETGNMQREVDLNELLESVTSDFELVIEEKQANILSGPLPVVEAVALQMNQLFYNLMSNALKFTQPGVPPVIEIRSREITHDEVVAWLPKPSLFKSYHLITFKDNGIGFENKYADQIFEVFKRLHNRSLYPGSGIGLSLCRRIVENHEGKLFVSSEPNIGTTFHIILPGI
jgi:PAS domain S-box-containing protein